MQNLESGYSEFELGPLPVCEIAIDYLKRGESQEGIKEVVAQLKNEGWGVEFRDEKSEDTSTVSLKGRKLITVFLQDNDEKKISTNHQLASIAHEYLIGKMLEDASNTLNPGLYIEKYFKKYALKDIEVASAIDPKGSTTMTGLILGHHRKNIFRSGPDTAEIDRLLSKL